MSTKSVSDYFIFTIFPSLEVIGLLSVNIPHPVPVPDARGADLPERVHLVGGVRSLGKIYLHRLSIKQVRDYSSIT